MSEENPYPLNSAEALLFEGIRRNEADAKRYADDAKQSRQTAEGCEYAKDQSLQRAENCRAALNRLKQNF
jgi:hypothetical protein